MKKSLIVLQSGYKECGAASLLSIIRYYHGNISISRLVELTNTNQEGTDFYQLKMAASKIGLDSVGYKVDNISDLKEMNQPFICQIIQEHFEHFVVVYKINNRKVQIMDPAVGEKIMFLESFKKIWTGYVMFFSPNKRLIFVKEENYLNKIIIETILKNKVIVLDILFLSIIFMIVSFLFSLYFEVVIDYILGSNVHNLLVITFIFSVLLLVKCIANFFRNELLIYLNQKLDCSILVNTFQKILLLPYSYYKNRTTGEFISRINDLISVKNVFNKIILTVCLDLVVFISFSSILFLRNTKLFLFLVLIIMIYILIFFIFKGSLKKYTELNQSNSAELNSYLIESIAGFETIKNMNLEGMAINRIEELYVKTLTNQFDYENVINLEIFMKDLITFIGTLLIQFLGFSMIMIGKMSLSELLTFIFLANYILDPIKNILDLNKEYFYAVNSIKRANHLFEVESDDLEKKTTFLLKGTILFQNLSFGYLETREILKNINLTIRNGEHVMVLGNSGSGKSTILKLLMKYYPLERGKVLFDGIDINDFSISNIRQQISCLFQNEILYQDTIRNNIVLNRCVSDEEFMEVVKITYVDEFVKDFFLGYDTLLEENGVNLSGGQRQRIMLARLLLKANQIILIDEGLNALDIDLERKILKNIFCKYSNNTIIMVSHRVENLDLFSRLIRMADGNILEDLAYCQGDIV